MTALTPSNDAEGLKVLETAGEVIDALGGTAAVARRYGAAAQNVSDWRETLIPSKYYAAMTDDLGVLGYVAPRHLWKMVEPAAPAGEAA